MSEDPDVNGKLTARVAKALVGKGWMIDYAPGERGKFFRVVVNRETRKSTVQRLVEAIDEVAKGVYDDFSVASEDRL